MITGHQLHKTCVPEVTQRAFIIPACAKTRHCDFFQMAHVKMTENVYFSPQSKDSSSLLIKNAFMKYCATKCKVAKQQQDTTNGPLSCNTKVTDA